MRNLSHCVVSIAVILALGACRTASAEIPDLSPAELQQAASHVFSGKVVRIYSSVNRSSPQWETDFRVAELQVARVEKGAHTGRLVYVRFWRKHFNGKGLPPPGAYGHREVPKVGAAVRVFVKQSEDGGFDVLLPNGFLATSRPENEKPKTSESG